MNNELRSASVIKFFLPCLVSILNRSYHLPYSSENKKLKVFQAERNSVRSELLFPLFIFEFLWNVLIRSKQDNLVESNLWNEI